MYFIRALFANALRPFLVLIISRDMTLLTSIKASVSDITTFLGFLFLIFILYFFPPFSHPQHLWLNLSHFFLHLLLSIVNIISSPSFAQQPPLFLLHLRFLLSSSSPPPIHCEYHTSRYLAQCKVCFRVPCFVTHYTR